MLSLRGSRKKGASGCRRVSNADNGTQKGLPGAVEVHSPASQLVCGKWYWLLEGPVEHAPGPLQGTARGPPEAALCEGPGVPVCSYARTPVVLVDVRQHGVNGQSTRRQQGKHSRTAASTHMAIPSGPDASKRLTTKKKARGGPVHVSLLQLRVMKEMQGRRQELVVGPQQLGHLELRPMTQQSHPAFTEQQAVWYMDPADNKWMKACVVAVHKPSSSNKCGAVDEAASSSSTALTWRRKGSRWFQRGGKGPPNDPGRATGRPSDLAPQASEGFGAMYMVKVDGLSALRCVGPWRLYNAQVAAQRPDWDVQDDDMLASTPTHEHQAQEKDGWPHRAVPRLFAWCPHGCGAVMALPGGSFAGNSFSKLATTTDAASRYCCFNCKRDFCSDCMEAPYHSGYTCDLQSLSKCIYCDCRILGSTDRQAECSGSPSVRWLREHISAAGADCSWCVEKLELLQLWQRVQRVCDNETCRHKLHDSCTRLLPCGHWCGGVRGEPCHPPCLEPTCDAFGRYQDASFSGRTLTDDSCAICLDTLSSSPVLQLQCGHLFHADCIRQTLKKGYPGPEISFKYLTCSLCGGGGGHGGGGVPGGSTEAPTVVPTHGSHLIQHPCIAHEVDPHIKLLQSVSRKGKQRLKAEGMLRDPDLQPGGAFDGRPVEYALSKFLFYKCSMCEEPYFGGMRACGAQAIQGMEYNPRDLICYSCNIQRFRADCEAHGRGTIEWKCRYCCSTASWFCFGSQHMCERCHASGVYADRSWKPTPCNPATCPLQVPHPPHGQEFCLGCSTCRVVRNLVKLSISDKTSCQPAAPRHVRAATVGAMPSGEYIKAFSDSVHSMSQAPKGGVYAETPSAPQTPYSPFTAPTSPEATTKGLLFGLPSNDDVYRATRPPGVYIGKGPAPQAVSVHASSRSH